MTVTVSLQPPSPAEADAEPAEADAEVEALTAEIGAAFLEYKEALRADLAAAGMPVPDVPAAIESAATQSHDDYLDCRDQYREHRVQFKQARAELGIMLVRQRDLCPEGEFRPWLRTHAVPVSTAYALMARVTANRSVKPAKPKPALALVGHRLRIRFQGHLLAVVTGAVAELAASGQPFDLTAAALTVLAPPPPPEPVVTASPSLVLALPVPIPQPDQPVILSHVDASPRAIA